MWRSAKAIPSYSCTAIQRHPIFGATSFPMSAVSAGVWRRTSSAWDNRHLRRAALIGLSIIHAISQPVFRPAFADERYAGAPRLGIGARFSLGVSASRTDPRYRLYGIDRAAARMGRLAAKPGTTVSRSAVCEGRRDDPQ